MKSQFAGLISINLYLFLLLSSTSTFAQKKGLFVYGDALPDAPELAARGAYQVGVQTLDLVNKGQIDILNYKDGIAPLYDRPLKVEVWYPAIGSKDETTLTTYEEVMGISSNPKRPNIPFTFLGRVSRDASPLTTEGGFPLVVVSHGYVGSRFLMTYLTENLASKGYIVVAIDHTESTFKDANGFQSTLLNRPKDILFVVDKIAKMGSEQNKHFLAGLVMLNIRQSLVIQWEAMAHSTQ